MKKVLMLAFALTLSMAAFAQKDALSVGVNVNYGLSSDYNALGFGAKLQWEFVENLRGEISGNYYLPKEFEYPGFKAKGYNVWDANLNFHYLFSAGEKVRWYPLVGVTYMSVNLTNDLKKWVEAAGGDASNGKVGFNAGLGIEYYLSNKFKLNAEGKYQYRKDADWFVLGIGAAFVF